MHWECDAGCPKRKTCRAKAGSEACTASRAKVARLPLMQYVQNRSKTELHVQCALGHRTLLVFFRAREESPLDMRFIEKWVERRFAQGPPIWCPVCQPVAQGDLRNVPFAYEVALQEALLV